jgi:hypothetical protein
MPNQLHLSDLHFGCYAASADGEDTEGEWWRKEGYRLAN